MIPKVIHYCWFGGGALPSLYGNCLESWGENLPDYEVFRWDESNTFFDNRFLKSAIKKKQWAFVSDYIRLRVLYENGGIYLDVDIEVVKNFSPLLENDLFLGFEEKGRLNTAVIGAVAKHPFIAECIQFIERRHEKGQPYFTAPEVATAVYCNSDWSKTVLACPEEYFYPYNPYDRYRDKPVLMYRDVSENTYCIHHWGKSWRQGYLERVLKFLAKRLNK